MEIVFDMERASLMFYVALFPSILFPNNSKLCSAREMRLPFVYLYASAFVLFVTGVAMEHFSTHRFIRKQRKTLGRRRRRSLWRAENWISLCSWTVPRRGILLAPSFCNRWPSVTTYHKGNRTCSIINSTRVFSCSLWELLGTIYFRI